MVIDGKGKIALPGFINTHTHSAMTLLRGYADDLPLQEWLETKIWPFEAGLSREDIYWGSKLAILEMIGSGTTTFLDMYFQMDMVAKAVKESGIRAVLSEGLIEANDGEKGLDSALEFCRSFQGSAEGRITTMLAPHSPYTCSQRYLERVSGLAYENGFLVNIHLAETRKEYEDSIKNTGKTPVKYLADIGLFKNPVVAAHCVYLDDSDLEILKDDNVSVAHNPASNMKLASGIARVADMMKKGINVSLGTDSVASNNNLDLIEEARIASYLQKVSKLDPGVMNIADIFDMLTINGAKALGLEKLGRIEKGYLADIVLVDTEDNSCFYPDHNNLSNLFYAGNGRDVDTVIINGAPVYRNKEFLTIDHEEVFYTVNKIIKNKV
jgi:5-methylthioadenosine/S-adenosylhomocysteine deaminase